MQQLYTKANLYQINLSLVILTLKTITFSKLKSSALSCTASRTRFFLAFSNTAIHNLNGAVSRRPFM